MEAILDLSTEKLESLIEVLKEIVCHRKQFEKARMKMEDIFDTKSEEECPLCESSSTESDEYWEDEMKNKSSDDYFSKQGEVTSVGFGETPYSDSSNSLEEYGAVEEEIMFNPVTGYDILSRDGKSVMPFKSICSGCKMGGPEKGPHFIYFEGVNDKKFVFDEATWTVFATWDERLGLRPLEDEDIDAVYQKYDYKCESVDVHPDCNGEMWPPMIAPGVKTRMGELIKEEVDVLGEDDGQDWDQKLEDYMRVGKALSSDNVNVDCGSHYNNVCQVCQYLLPMVSMCQVEWKYSCVSSVGGLTHSSCFETCGDRNFIQFVVGDEPEYEMYIGKNYFGSTYRLNDKGIIAHNFKCFVDKYN